MVWDYEVDEYAKKYEDETPERREAWMTWQRRWRKNNVERNNRNAKKARKAYLDRWKARDPEGFRKWRNNRMKLYMRKYNKRKREQGE